MSEAYLGAMIRKAQKNAVREQLQAFNGQWWDAVYRGNPDIEPASFRGLSPIGRPAR